MTINYLTSRNAIILAVFLVYFASANGQYCAATTSTSTTRYINNFTTGGAVFNINNASAFSAGGYGNFTAQSVSQIAGQAITFSAAYTGGTFGFRIWVDWNNDFDFADVGETLFTSGTYSAANTGSITVPTGTPMGNYRMRIRADYWATSPLACGVITDGETEDYTLNVAPPPPCPTYPAGLAATAVTSTTATINWSAPSPAPANGYEYYVSTSATTPIAGTTPTGSTLAGNTSASLSGLLTNTTYYFWVRSRCNVVDKGAWVGAATFYTGYCASTATSSTYFINSFSTTGAQTNINNTSTFSAGGYGNFTSQSASQSAGLTVSFASAYTGGTFGFAIWIDWNNDMDFVDPGETMYTSGIYSGSNTGTFTVPVAAAVGSYRMRIRADYWAVNPAACGAITSGETEDYTFIVATPPACALNPSALATSAVTSTTATISWIAPSPVPANGYEYFLSTSPATPVNGTIPTGTTSAAITSANLSGLAADTTYYFWVRSNCNGVDKGSWIGAGSFFTGYCLATSTNSGFYIDNFTTNGGLTNITNTTAYSAGGYGNYTVQAASQIAGQALLFSSTFTGGTFGFAIWVDWNNDMDFGDPGESVFNSGTYSTGNSGSFTIPGAAANGNYRMRIRADYLATSPSACGVISNGETEDYTITVSPPLPCSGNPSSVTANLTSTTTATISWTAGSPAPANGYQYYYSSSNVSPNAGTIPSGSTSAGILSADLTGLAPGSVYYFWVRSNCGGGLGQGSWIGPVSFTIPSCGIGNSIGTTTLGCPSVLSGGLGLLGADPPPIECTSASCVNLEANYLQLGQTDDYTVEAIPYAPPYQFGCLENPVSVNNDDVWSPTVSLPFDFCFYGNTYNQCLISSNGVITFDQTTNVPGGYSGWMFSSNLPNAALFRNSIFGVYHDIDPQFGGEVGWELITLNTGCRALVAAWSDIPMFSTTCNSMLYTGMIVLYENTNIIDVYIEEKNVCGSWNEGNAIVGVQNAAGTLGTTAPGRNGLDANWTITNEAWRFVPSGAPITSIKWYEGAGTSGPVIGNTDIINVCPAATTIYTAEVTYLLCNGETLIETEIAIVTVNANKMWNGSMNTDWNTAVNWTPVGVPTSLDCVVIPNVTNDCIISGISYDAFAYSLTILNGGLLNLNSENNLTVSNAVNVNTGGTFNIKNDASLLQVNNVSNIGSINMERITEPMYRYDYTYWGSPVTQASGFTLGGLSPLTLYDKYFNWTPSVGGASGIWINESSAAVMDPRRGYIVRAPQTYSVNPSVRLPYTANFIGTPNNGDITCPITFGSMGAAATDDKWNLLGNPYPSAVNASAFLNNVNNTSVIDGTIYFWTHNTPWSTAFPDPFYGNYAINYTSADYASWNTTGGVGTIASSGGPAPNGYIAAGQSFFVKSLGVNGNAVFKNTMRVADNNTQFFRQGNAGSNGQQIKKHRIWLNLTNEAGAFNQILVGYITGATSGWDRGLDGQRFSDGDITFYSMIPNHNLVIQGRPLPFHHNDIVPLGYTAGFSDSFSIKIDHIDGLFENRDIYLEDKLFDLIHDLKLSPYVFFSEAGTFNDRFVLRYTNNINVEKTKVKSEVSAFLNNGTITVSATENIALIMVFDITGKLVTTHRPTAAIRLLACPFLAPHGAYIIKIQLESGTVYNKKLLH